MTTYGYVAELEYRPDKKGAEGGTPSTLIQPNGTIAATTDLALCGVMTRLTTEAVMRS